MNSFALKQRSVILLSGMIWFIGGMSLMWIGLNLLAKNSSHWVDESGVVLVIALALLIGALKGKFVMRKAAAKMIARVETFGKHVPFFKAFGARYLILIAVMMSLGILLRFFDPFIRGVVDTAVGAALIQGALHYFTYDRKSL
jgi:hypothetical protein